MQEILPFRPTGPFLIIYYIQNSIDFIGVLPKSMSYSYAFRKEEFINKSFNILTKIIKSYYLHNVCIFMGKLNKNNEYLSITN